MNIRRGINVTPEIFLSFPFNFYFAKKNALLNVLWLSRSLKKIKLIEIKKIKIYKENLNIPGIIPGDGVGVTCEI